MPLYEYQCEACGHRFEKIQKFSDPLIEECPNCGERKVHKLVSSPAIQFKGTGWYITDYARKGSVPSETSSKSDDSKTSDDKGSVSAGSESKSKSTETKSAESKPDSKGADSKTADSKSAGSKSSDSKPATTTQS
jgi:putative FmdB family regulatory protein